MFVSRSLQQETIVLGETNPSQISYIMDFAPSSSIIDVTFSVTNVGTTRVPSALLTIYWPFNSPVDSQYYLYPIQAEGVRYVSLHVCMCHQELIMCFCYLSI